LIETNYKEPENRKSSELKDRIEVDYDDLNYKLFEYRKLSQEYFSGNFPEHSEHGKELNREENRNNPIQEQAIDDDQSLEIDF